MTLGKRCLFNEDLLDFTRFYYDIMVKMLYHSLYNNILLRCLSNSEAQKVIKEAHDGICEAHQSGLKLKDRLTDLAIIGRL